MAERGSACILHALLDLTGVITRIAARSASLESDDPEGDRQRAAVAAILRPGAAGEAELLFIRRAEHPGDLWSGHMAFPGGRRDPGDRSLAATAKRETREEIGLDLDAHGQLVARLPDVQAVARGKRLDLVITPFVFAVETDHTFTLNHEVAETIWAPLRTLVEDPGTERIAYVHEGITWNLPCVRVRHAGEERVVWGLTYQMLRALVNALKLE